MAAKLLLLSLLAACSSPAAPCVEVAYFYRDYLLSSSAPLEGCEEVEREEQEARGVTMRVYLCECS